MTAVKGEKAHTNVSENFISSYLNHTSIYESPTSFWKWSAYSSISAILKDRCFVKRGDSALFPNMYVLLIAESSGHRKNAPVELSQNLVDLVKSTKTVSGRASVQGILDELAHTETDSHTGKVIKIGSAAFFATELSAGIVSDPDGLKILTDIYDFKMNTYKNRLRTGPSFDIDRIVFSMFSASNQAMLTGLFDQTVIHGGFVARTLIITPGGEFRKPNSLMRVDYEALNSSKEILVKQLKQISQLYGEIKIDDSAVEEYESWYNPFRSDYMQKKDSTGIIGRIHTHVLKVAMVLAANKLRLCIKKEDIEQSIEECLGLIPNYNLLTMSNTKSETGNVGGIVLTELLAAKDYMLSRKIIVRNNWQNFDIELLDKAMVQLEEAGFIRQHQTKDGIFYQLTQQCLDMLR